MVMLKRPARSQGSERSAWALLARKEADTKKNPSFQTSLSQRAVLDEIQEADFGIKAATESQQEGLFNVMPLLKTPWPHPCGSGGAVSPHPKKQVSFPGDGRGGSHPGLGHVSVEQGDHCVFCSPESKATDPEGTERPLLWTHSRLTGDRCKQLSVVKAEALGHAQEANL